MSTITEHLETIEKELDELSDEHSHESNEWSAVHDVIIAVEDLKKTYKQTKNI